MTTNRARYYRDIARTVLRRYCEFEEGVLQTVFGPVFDPRVLDYRVDVELCFRGFSDKETNAVLLIHRDGLTGAQAINLSGIPTDQPDQVIKDIETRLGHAFEQHGLHDFLQYLGYLR